MVTITGRNSINSAIGLRLHNKELELLQCAISSLVCAYSPTLYFTHSNLFAFLAQYLQLQNLQTFHLTKHLHIPQSYLSQNLLNKIVTVYNCDMISFIFITKTDLFEQQQYSKLKMKVQCKNIHSV